MEYLIGPFLLKAEHTLSTTQLTKTYANIVICY